MIFRLEPQGVAFPSPQLAEEDGLLAVGGNLRPERLLEAYRRGIFPWYSRPPILWWSPNPRMVLYPKNFHYGKSLRRIVEQGSFSVSFDRDFPAVIQACATTPRHGQWGTWIVPEMIAVYTQLHHLGYAHSVEVTMDGCLVGGLYGISVGDVFCGESMFHTVSNASKVAFVHLMNRLAMHGCRLVDAQQETPLLASFGAAPIPRHTFLQVLKSIGPLPPQAAPWRRHSVALSLGANVGDKAQTLRNAVQLIGREAGAIQAVSPLYETPPWGFQSSNTFLNQALLIDTDLEALQLLRTLLEIEQRLGRQRTNDPLLAPQLPQHKTTYADRPIDIDIIFFDSRVIDLPELQVPHPHMHRRRFVLQPLCDLMPYYRHPTLRFPLQKLLEICPDTTKITPIITPSCPV